MILVTGASGNIGRPLVEQLVAAGAQVRAVTRDPAAAGLPAGTAVAGDPSRPETLADLLAGVEAVFVHPVAVGAAAAELLARAADAGARRAVLLSSGEVRDDVAEQTGALAVRHARLEDAVTGSGLDRTFLRPYEFATNLVRRWAGPIRGPGVVTGAYGQASAALVSERDVAAVAAAALLSPDHAGAVYRLTGPAALTRVEMLAVLAEVLDRPLRFREVPREEALADLVGRGMPRPVAEAVLDLEERSVHEPAVVADGVERATGRPARTFAEWAADHAADFS